jgi:hypothetical protein
VGQSSIHDLQLPSTILEWTTTGIYKNIFIELFKFDFFFNFKKFIKNSHLINSILIESLYVINVLWSLSRQEKKKKKKKKKHKGGKSSPIPYPFSLPLLVSSHCFYANQLMESRVPKRVSHTRSHFFLEMSTIMCSSAITFGPLVGFCCI